MHDIVVTDIPQEHYDLICEEAAKLGITADDYLTILVKGYALGLRVSEQDKNKISA
jgi:hypothetical protein